MSYTAFSLEHDNGNLAIQGQIESGQMIGTWRGFYRAGQLMWEAEGGWLNCIGLYRGFIQDHMEKIHEIQLDYDHGLVFFGMFLDMECCPNVRLLNFHAEDGSLFVKEGEGTAYFRELVRDTSSEHHPGNALDEARDPDARYERIVTADFVDGLMEGYRREYMDGRIITESRMSRGLKNGIERIWHPETGKLIRLRSYQDSISFGLWVYWDDSGELDHASVYDDQGGRKLIFNKNKSVVTIRKGTGYIEDPYELTYYFKGVAIETVPKDDPDWLEDILDAYEQPPA